MDSWAEGYLLRIFINEADRHGGAPLFRWLVQQARDQGMAGATVLRGMVGFGASGKTHEFRVFTLREDEPVVVEIVDEVAKIEAFLPVVEAALSSCCSDSISHPTASAPAAAWCHAFLRSTIARKARQPFLVSALRASLAASRTVLLGSVSPSR